jgi:hypothetical protein
MYPECILDDLLAVFTGGYFGMPSPWTAPPLI